MSGYVMPKEQYDFIKGIQDYMLEASNMKEGEAWDFGFSIWQFQKWLKGYMEKLQLSPETSTNGSYIRDGRLMHDLVYRGEVEYIDPISRQAAIDAVEKAVFKGVAKSAIESLPPVEPKPVCEDAISRADTLKALCAECDIKCEDGTDKEAHCTEYAAIKSMPPVEPKRPKRAETMMVDGEPTEIDPLSYEVGYTHGQMEEHYLFSDKWGKEKEKRPWRHSIELEPYTEDGLEL